MKQVGIALIGCGGRLRSISRRTCLQNENLKIIGLFDVDSQAIEDTKKFFAKSEKYKHGVEDVKEYKTLEECVSDPQIEWVMIGSWNSKHSEQTVAAFNAGKHVFCEKPLATTIEDCLKMRDAWITSRKNFAIGFTLRYSPHYRKIKELVESGTIGDIISMEFNETLGFNHGGYIHSDWRRHTKNAGTHLLEKCSHDVDLVNWIVDSRVKRTASFSGLNFFIPENEHHVDRIGKNKDGIEAYKVMANKPDRPSPFSLDKDINDNQVIIMEYENKVRATFHLSCNAGIPERRMYILGSEGSLRADVLTGVIETKRIGFDTELISHDSGVSGGHGGGDEILTKEISDCMIKGDIPPASLEDGMNSAVACFGMDKADQTGRVVDLSSLWEQIDA